MSSMRVCTSAFASPSTGTSTRACSPGLMTTGSETSVRSCGVLGTTRAMTWAGSRVALSMRTGIVVFSPVTSSTAEPSSGRIPPVSSATSASAESTQEPKLASSPTPAHAVEVQVSAARVSRPRTDAGFPKAAAASSAVACASPSRRRPAARSAASRVGSASGARWTGSESRSSSKLCSSIHGAAAVWLIASAQCGPAAWRGSVMSRLRGSKGRSVVIAELSAMSSLTPSTFVSSGPAIAAASDRPVSTASELSPASASATARVETAEEV